MVIFQFVNFDLVISQFVSYDSIAWRSLSSEFATSRFLSFEFVIFQFLNSESVSCRSLSSGFVTSRFLSFKLLLNFISNRKLINKDGIKMESISIKMIPELILIGEREAKRNEQRKERMVHGRDRFFPQTAFRGTLFQFLSISISISRG